MTYLDLHTQKIKVLLSKEPSEVAWSRDLKITSKHTSFQVHLLFPKLITILASLQSPKALLLDSCNVRASKKPCNQQNKG